MEEFLFLVRRKHFMLWYQLVVRDIYEQERFLKILQHKLETHGLNHLT